MEQNPMFDKDVIIKLRIKARKLSLKLKQAEKRTQLFYSYTGIMCSL